MNQSPAVVLLRKRTTGATKMATEFYQPSDWRLRAELTRARAVQATDPAANQALLAIAAAYDRLAEMAEKAAYGARLSLVWSTVQAEVLDRDIAGGHASETARSGSAR
jgi:hypothetical protein